MDGNLFTSKSQAIAFAMAEYHSIDGIVHCKDVDSWAHRDDTIQCDNCYDHVFTLAGLDQDSLCGDCAEDAAEETRGLRQLQSDYYHAVL